MIMVNGNVLCTHSGVEQASLTFLVITLAPLNVVMIY